MGRLKRRAYNRSSRSLDTNVMDATGRQASKRLLSASERVTKTVLASPV